AGSASRPRTSIMMEDMHVPGVGIAASCRRARRLSALAVVGALSFAACSGDDGDDQVLSTTPDITLLTTTTEAPPFEPETTVPAIEQDPTETEPPTTVLVTTTTAPVPTTTAAETTTTVPAPASPFSIQTDGIGAAAFGAAPQGVVDFVTSVLGPPTSDTGWIDPFEIGPCNGSELRQVQWDTLLLEFGDSSEITQGRQHFYGYYYGDAVTGAAEPAGLATSQGLGLGSSVAALIEAHPDVELFSGDEFLGPNFKINDALRGTVTGLADTDVITSFVGGLPCNG
ncbi:MAG: hypothetical protein AAFP84_07820, partial [Actinomycetota bacterium]